MPALLKSLAQYFSARPRETMTTGLVMISWTLTVFGSFPGSTTLLTMSFRVTIPQASSCVLRLTTRLGDLLLSHHRNCVGRSLASINRRHVLVHDVRGFLGPHGSQEPCWPSCLLLCCAWRLAERPAECHSSLLHINVPEDKRLRDRAPGRASLQRHRARLPCGGPPNSTWTVTPLLVDPILPATRPTWTTTIVLDQSSD